MTYCQLLNGQKPGFPDGQEICNKPSTETYDGFRGAQVPDFPPHMGYQFLNP